MSSWTTSAIRRSRRCCPARSTAAAAAFSHDTVLDPTNSMILYTLSGITASSPFTKQSSLSPVLFSAVASSCSSGEARHGGERSSVGLEWDGQEGREAFGKWGQTRFNNRQFVAL